MSLFLKGKMIDLTEEFFTEIYQKYKEIASSINDEKVLDKEITGTCVVLSVEENRMFDQLVS